MKPKLVLVGSGIAGVRALDEMVGASKRPKRAVVAGGNVLGLEAANRLLRRGVHVTVVHAVDRVMEGQLDETAAELLRSALERRGIVFRMGAIPAAIVGEDRVRAVRLGDGTELPADLVVTASLTRDAGHPPDPSVYAAGACVRYRASAIDEDHADPVGMRVEAADEDGDPRDPESFAAGHLKVTGIGVFSAGRLHGGDGHEEITFQDPARGRYKKLVLDGDRLVGAILYGDTSDARWYHQLIREGVDVDPFRDTLIFGRDVSEGGPVRRTEDLVDAPDGRQVCHCAGVCKGTIVETIRAKGLTTLAEVKTHTKAASSCGLCTRSVERILEATLGDRYRMPANVPMCECTDKGHDEVREAIVRRRLSTIDAVMRELDWSSTDGCAKCRPAINYYLVCAWPTKDADDPQSRIINERVHANIQKDGTYSVVPRVWGGVTTPTELRAIAEIAERFDVPTVKITGGQRIDLLGVKKEDLPAIWADLGRAGFVSGHAYGRAVRTVKTCVGSEWCRFGVQDSTRMGIDLERQTWGSWAPHKIKMGVSGCPRNCAEATIKDFGVVAIEGGWELYVGGNGGMRVRAADLLGRVTTEAEVLEYGCAFLQLYREEGHYLERTAHFVERVGIDYVRERIAGDPAGRRILFEGFQESQARAQVDPWAERAKGAHADDFVPVSRVISGGAS